MSVGLAAPRLRLRQFRPDDIDDLHAMDGDDRVMRYLGTGLAGRTREQSVRALELIEIAYRLPHACWGQGYATEMAKAVLDYGFRTLRLPRIVGVAWPENVPSQRVLDKIGMRDDGVAVHYGRPLRVYSATPETVT